MIKKVFIVSEERPTVENILDVLKVKYDIDSNGEVQIVPEFQDNKFQFAYRVSNLLNIDVRIYIGKGNSSFVDFLVFDKNERPCDTDVPAYAIEETKTMDSESRNTGVYQRLSKFAFIKSYFPDIELYMLYNKKALASMRTKKLTDTNIFGNMMMETNGVKILGKEFILETKSFNNYNELISIKNSMRMPPKGNVPIKIEVESEELKISGRLFKSGGISHDPNIGALTYIAQTLRNLGYDKRITITSHGLNQEIVNRSRNNKFLLIASMLDIELDGISYEKQTPNDLYWKYDNYSEKVGSILFNNLFELYGYETIYENHAGCERGYFFTKDRTPITIPKTNDNKEKINIPDYVVKSDSEKVIYLIEAKPIHNLNNGILEIEEYDQFVKLVGKYYPDYRIEIWLTTNGTGTSDKLHERELLRLNDDGKIIVNDSAPASIVEIFSNYDVYNFEE